MPLSTSDISLCLVLSSEGMAVNSWLILYIDTTVIGAKDFLRGCLVSHSRRLLTGDCTQLYISVRYTCPNCFRDNKRRKTFSEIIPSRKNSRVKAPLLM